jgi:hypothetical protein
MSNTHTITHANTWATSWEDQNLLSSTLISSPLNIVEILLSEKQPTKNINLEPSYKSRILREKKNHTYFIDLM